MKIEGDSHRRKVRMKGDEEKCEVKHEKMIHIRRRGSTIIALRSERL